MKDILEDWVSPVHRCEVIQADRSILQSGEDHGKDEGHGASDGEKVTELEEDVGDLVGLVVTKKCGVANGYSSLALYDLK